MIAKKTKLGIFPLSRLEKRKNANFAGENI